MNAHLVRLIGLVESAAASRDQQAFEHPEDIRYAQAADRLRRVAKNLLGFPAENSLISRYNMTVQKIFDQGDPDLVTHCLTAIEKVFIGRIGFPGGAMAIDAVRILSSLIIRIEKEFEMRCGGGAHYR